MNSEVGNKSNSTDVSEFAAITFGKKRPSVSKDPSELLKSPKVRGQLRALADIDNLEKR